jgi:leucyl-tRNA synthetase
MTSVMQRYNPKEIEAKWQAKWEADKIYHASEDPAKPKKYVLEYFPYPSGAAMHVGHVRNYTIGDAIARFNRMNGYNVLHPMGWDAFGLPAENYAIKHKISPRQAIDENTTRFKEQLIRMGFSYDWSREIDSTDPKYYKWTQWFFLLLFKKGLAYQQESLQWWCPHDKTVLANEQVENGKCWRCGHEVEKKALKQWFFKITDYADRLLDDLEDLNWSESIKTMQRNWIGRSKGAEVDFLIDQDLAGKEFVFLHGKGWTKDGAFWPWLKRQVENKGGSVQIHSLPNSDKPNIEEQVEFILKNYSFSKNTVIVTHSLGGVVAMKLIPRLSVKIDRLIMAAPPISPKLIDNKLRPELEHCCDWNFDFQSVKNSVGQITVLRDVNDHIIPSFHPARIAESLDAKLVDARGNESHFDGTEEKAVWAEVTNFIKVFTTAHDTIFGVTFMVLAPEHDLLQQIVPAEHEEQVRHYQAKTRAKSDIERQETEREKTGIFTGAYAINPVNDEKVPIWIADYVLAGYGTGAVMAVPGEDARDYEFAQKFDLPIVYTTEQQKFVNYQTELKNNRMKYKLANSGEFDGLDFETGRQKILDKIIELKAGQATINYKMRDWLISRQRYWGAPIPIIHCPKDGAVAVPEDQLPVVLPEVKSYEPSGDGHSPLANVPEFVNTACPKCGGSAKRETDTMDGFACSSWYFLRFADPHNDQEAFSKAKADFWLPVDDYIGGAEHAVMHLLYARFWTKAMHDEKLINFSEPFTTLRNQGMILAPDGQKMSKSKGNTIEPDGIIEQGYGADSIRIMELFIGPWNQSANWSVEGMGGSFRFLQRIWTLTQEHLENEDDSIKVESDKLQKATHKATKKVTQDLEGLSFNTAIASLMELVNELYKLKLEIPVGAPLWHRSLERLVQLLAPFAPHISEELWRQLGHEESVHLSDWPKYDEKYLVQATVTVVIQVNGKLRGELEVAVETTEQAVVEAAKANERVATYLKDQTVKKTIYVPGRLVNFVV